MPEGYQSEAATEPEKPSHLGAVLGVLIVILVLILGGLYLWGTTLNQDMNVLTEPATRPTAEENNEPESTKAEAEVETMQVLSTSDEINAIEADLDNTDLEDLDSELTSIEAELDSALE